MNSKNFHCNVHGLKDCFIQMFMNGKLSVFFLLKSISEKNSNFMVPLIFRNTLFKECQNFSKKLCRTGANFYVMIFLCHRSYYLNIFGLKNVSKLKMKVYFPDFSNHSFNFIGNLVDISCKYKSWDTIKCEYNLTDKNNFNGPNQFMQYQNYGQIR